MEAKSRNQSTIRSLIPLAKWRELGHPCFSQAQIRWLAFQNKNGFRDRCVVKIEGRLLIDETELFAWIDANQERRSAA